tara:strand:+ start:715 stop:1035 length:321 start_codon:yes stop_codon:yes gene_type:complete
MYDFPEEIPGQVTPELFQQYTRDNLGIDITPLEAEKFTTIMNAIQGAEGGGSIGDTDVTGPTMDVPTRGPPLSEIGVEAGGADNMLDRDRMMQQLIRRPGYQGLGY